MAVRPRALVLRLGAQWGIFDQLVLEEAILRSDSRNWIIFNRGRIPPTIVMGSSGVPQKLMNIPAVKTAQIPVVRRFTGGGTVITDNNTVFVSYIFNSADIPGNPVYPRPILRWSIDKVYEPVFHRLTPDSAFGLQEHDYCFGEKKFAGNAQAISRNRFVHHTSFLWRFDPSLMEYLTLPDKRPDYRRDRPHHDFLTELAAHVPKAYADEPDCLMDAITTQMSSQFELEDITAEEAAEVTKRPQERKANMYETL